MLREVQIMWNVKKNTKYVKRSANHVKCKKEYEMCLEKCKPYEMYKRVWDVLREVPICEMC